MMSNHVSERVVNLLYIPGLPAPEYRTERRLRLAQVRASLALRYKQVAGHWPPEETRA